MSRGLLRRADRDIVIKRGWRTGSDLEDSVSRTLSGVFKSNQVVQQYRIGKYRVDYAWPDLRIALEVDGWYHQSPDGAAKDARRDSWLRSTGWLILRIDDRHGVDCMQEQLVRVCQLVHAVKAGCR